MAGQENTGQVTKTYSFTYDASGALVSGQETIDGIVYDYDSSGNVTKSKDTSALTADLIISGEDLLAIPEVLRAASGDTYAITDPITGTSDSETTYYNDAGGILGYKTTTQYTYAGETSTSSTYSDAEWNWVGTEWSDAYGSGFNFRMNKTAEVDIDGDGNADIGVDGTANATYVEESGKSSWDNDTESYEYVYNFDSSGNFLGGYEISNGIKTSWGPGWQNLGQSSDVDLAAAASDLANTGVSVLDTAAKDALPSSLVAPSGETYAKVETMPGGNGDTETTYYDANGTVLGYAMETGWSYDDPSGTTQSGYKHQL